MTAGDLPLWLLGALDQRLEGRSRSDLAGRSARISAAYRSGRPSSGVVRSEDDALAYAVARMPATYAATARVLEEIRSRLPDFAPQSVLDAGAGPGTAGFAAVGAWPATAALTQVDHNAAFLAMARAFGDASGLFVLRNSRQIEGELADPTIDRTNAFDLVLLGYVLAEADPATARRIVREHWSRAVGTLVVVEPGTPGGFERVLAARAELIAGGARILAPCPHEAACPLKAPDWCHFSERLPRRRAHMAVKDATLPFEDERFAYVVALRDALFRSSDNRARVLAPPDRRKDGVRLKLCRPDGAAATTTIARREKARFAEARRLDWGDLAPND